MGEWKHETIFQELINNQIIVSKKKLELNKRRVKFLGHINGNGQIELQPHIAESLLAMPDWLEDKKQLQRFLGTLNYARMYIKDLSKIAGPLFGKCSSKNPAKFSKNDAEIVQQLKNQIKNILSYIYPLKMNIRS